MNNKIYYIINSSGENASLNRLRNFEKGLKSNGVECEILYPYHNFKNYHLLNSVISYLLIFFKVFKSKKNDIFINYGISNYLSILIIFKWKIRIIEEITEFPYSLTYERYKEYKKKESKILNKFKNINGLITCSEVLAKHYKKYIKEQPIHISPMIIDEKKYINVKCNPIYEKPYIGYTGSLVNNKDGVFDLIKSFKLISNKYPNYKLYIAGGGWKEEIINVKKLIDDLELKKNVILLGYIAHHKIPEFLVGADVLALSRPNNLQAKGGFPSKVGEYLATGVPIVITDVGEISKYLIDGYNCFMSIPDDVYSFSEKLIEAINLKDKKQISINAINTSLNFNLNKESKRLIEFVKNINL